MNERPQEEPASIVAPDVLEIDSMKWQKETSIGNSDGILLTHYFKSNPSMVGSPELHGTPEVYHGAKHRRRFYWIKNTLNKISWSCVEYKDGSFLLSEGQGSPFHNPPQ